MDTGKRIRSLRKEQDISADELAAHIGCSRSTIFRYESGDIEKVPSSVIEPIADYLNTTPAYLMGWTDDPIDYDNLDIPIPTALYKEGIDVKQYLKFKQAVDQDALNEQQSIPYGAVPYVPVKSISIPLVGSVNCGLPIFAEDNIEGYVQTPVDDIQKGETYFWLKAKGDSMSNVGIQEGDLLLIRQQSDVDSGEIAVVTVNGDDATLKRIIKKENAIILQPENPSYETKIFIGNETALVNIRGRLMEVKKKF